MKETCDGECGKDKRFKKGCGNFLCEYLDDGEKAIEVKQLTIEVLRDRFSMHMLSGGWHKDILLAIREDGSYDDFTVDMNWNTYKQCAIDCGILKQ